MSYNIIDDKSGISIDMENYLFVYAGLDIHSVIFYHIALSMQTCHMLMAEPSTDMLTAQPITYDMFLFQSI